jgi:hypothetical protein
VLLQVSVESQGNRAPWRDIYEREIRRQVEAANHGRFLVLDINSHLFEIADDDLTASDRLLKKNPKAVLTPDRLSSHGWLTHGPSPRRAVARP